MYIGIKPDLCFRYIFYAIFFAAFIINDHAVFLTDMTAVDDQIIIPYIFSNPDLIFRMNRKLFSIYTVLWNYFSGHHKKERFICNNKR